MMLDYNQLTFDQRALLVIEHVSTASFPAFEELDDEALISSTEAAEIISYWQAGGIETKIKGEEALNE